jgi:predicted Zn finger-like uncharacterized protein
MRLAEGLRRQGFRKWYERRLLQGRVHLALVVLCAAGMLGAAGTFTPALPLGEQVPGAVLLAACFAVGAWALRRYQRLQAQAEATAIQAACPACKTYARFVLEHEALDGSAVQVSCDACGHRWTITVE